MSQKRVRSLHFNLKDGENVVFHHEHRSKKGRERMFRDNTDAFRKFKRIKEKLKYDVDDESLRYLKNKYNI